MLANLLGGLASDWQIQAFFDGNHKRILKLRPKHTSLHQVVINWLDTKFPKNIQSRATDEWRADFV
ncbi:hypothetical protein EJK49_0739 [Moraxella catarrhalis]|nr:hypothetical protein EJK49_0739 [Moraxella catarrhalis]